MADIQNCAYGKTCREHSAPTGERISDVSLKRSVKSLKSQYMCLDLRSGTLPGQSWETAGHLLGDSSMLNTSESLKDAKECFLSWILLRGGGTAAEILFESCGMSGDTQESQEPGQDTASTAGEGTPDAVSVYENHSADSRYRELSGVCTTLASNLGTGGNNQPLVLDHAAYRICSEKSNGFQSSNPHVGIYEADVSPTLDTSDQSPNKSQGGIVVLEGNGCRPSHKGDGYKESEVMYTLNTIERHGVAYGLGRDTFNCGQNASFSLSMDEEIQPTMTSRGPGAVAHSDDECYTLSKASHFTVAFKDAVAPTLMASDYKDAVAVSYAPHYIVRKLTPVECARLQGFPDWWCSDLGTAKEDVTEDDLDFWRGVFETHMRLVTQSAKAKTDRQILKWLESPHTDAAEYKMWGNGVALPCVQWIMQQIVRVVEESDD